MTRSCELILTLYSNRDRMMIDILRFSSDNYQVVIWEQNKNIVKCTKAAGNFTAAYVQASVIAGRDFCVVESWT